MKKPPVKDHRPQLRHRGLGRWLIVVLILALLLGVAFAAVTRGPIARRIVLAQLRPLSDAEVDIRGATIALNGTITIDELSVAVPGLDGQASRILEARSATIALTGLFSGSPTPRSIHIINPIVRISQNTETGALNFATIHPRPTGTSDAPLPAISVTGGVLELGEHTGSDYQPLRRLPVVATLEPTPAADTFAFSIVQDSPDAAPFSLSGIIHPDRMEVAIDELDLAAWPNDAIPSRVRDLHRQLAIKGRILPTDLIIYNTGRIELLLELNAVELRLPVENAPLARGVMTEVDGTLRINDGGVHAELEGLLDGVPAHASFHADRLTQDSPFTCDIDIGRVRLAENLERLTYIPHFVLEQLQNFSNPTAELALDITLTRGEGDTEVLPQGFIYLFNGVASYREFPYEFTDLAATFELAGDFLLLRNVTGRAESGARVEATGRIGPLGPTAEAIIDITVTDVPLDSRLRAGLGQNHRDLYDALLSRTAYRELQDLGLIQTRAQARERAARLDALEADDTEPDRDARIAQLEAELAAPVFTIGGRAAVEVHIHRHLGEENFWERDIVVRIPAAGFLAEQFPLPIIAENVTLHIDDETATLAENEGVFRGLEGGIASIAAVAALGPEESIPTITVDATDIPVSPLLINAIPGDPGTATARDLLTRLGLSGTLDCTARIGHADLPLFDINVRPRAMNARVDDWTPADAPPTPGLRLEGITGVIHARPDALELDLVARLPDRTSAPPRARLAAGINYGLDIPDHLEIRTLSASVDRLPLETPIEQLVALVNEPAAEQLHDLRTRFDPRGTVRVEVVQASDAQGTPATTLTISDARLLRLRYREADFSLADSTGRIVLTRGEAVGIALDHFGGPLAYADRPLGLIDLDGLVRVEPAEPDAPPSGRIEARLTGGSYSPDLAEQLLPEGAEGVRDLLRAAEPEATFDLAAVIGLDANGAAALESLELSPRSIALTHNGRRLDLSVTAGSIRVDGTAAHFNGLAFAAKDWSATVDGRFDAPEEAARDADLAFTLRATSLTDELRALLPPQLADIAEGLELQIAGPIALDGGHLLLTQRPGNTRLDILGHLEVAEASAAVGVDIDRLSAAIDFVAHTDSTLDSPEYEMRVFAPGFRAAEIWMSDGSMTIRSAPEGGAIEIGPLVAEAHGGRVAASAFVWNSADGTANYDLDATLSGVRFAPVLRDLALDTDPPDPDSEADESRGVIAARLSMHGVAGGARRGVGHIQVSDGRVLKLPLLVPLIEVSNLRLPMGEQLDVAHAQFYISDDLTTFEELSVYSRSIELLGYGTLDLADQQLDLRVNSRSNTRIPLLSPVLQNLRDELVTIRVQGTLREPEIATVPLTSTRAALGSLFGREPTEQDLLLRDIKRRAVEFRERSRLSSKQIHTAVENLDRDDNNQDR